MRNHQKKQRGYGEFYAWLAPFGALFIFAFGTGRQTAMLVSLLSMLLLLVILAFGGFDPED